MDETTMDETTMDETTMDETTHMRTAEVMGLGTVSAMIDDDGVLIVTDEEGTIIEYEGTEAIVLWSLMAR